MSPDRAVSERVAERATPLASAADPSLVSDLLRGSVGLRESGASRVVTGHLRGLDDEGRLRFQPEDGSDPVPIAIGIELSDGTIVRAARRERRALVIRTDEPTPRLILIGLVRERVSEKARAARPGRLEVVVDGEKLKLEAEHDIELRCGQASLTLRYDGRIELRGTHILSASRGPNRVKGATIDLN